jgi:hypothetical protein
VREELRAANDSMSQPKVRPAAVYEQAEFLDGILSAAKKSISISSLGLSAIFVNPKFVEHLTSVLQRGVKVELRVHKVAAEKGARTKEFSRPYTTIEKLSNKFKSHLSVYLVSEDRYFHAAFDDRIAMVTNRPFLSGYGRTRTFEQFSGFVIQDRVLVASYLERIRRNA